MNHLRLVICVFQGKKSLASVRNGGSLHYYSQIIQSATVLTNFELNQLKTPCVIF
jgi:hypothetical protein